MGTIINNMDEQYISIWELISLQLFLGSIIYIVSCIVLFFVLRKVENRKYKIALSLLVQFCISVLLSLIIWQSWNIDIDIMAWIPFLILLLIVCSCGGIDGDCGCLDNGYDC